MSPKPERVRLYDFAATIVRETPSALLLDHGADAPAWFPKSQTEDNGDGTFTCPEWLAIEKRVV